MINYYSEFKKYINKKIRIRDSVLAFYKSGYLQIYSMMDFKLLEYKVNPFVTKLIPLLNGKNDLNKINHFLSKYNDYSINKLMECINCLKNDNLLYTNDFIEPNMKDNFSRQIMLFNELHSSFPKSTDNAINMQRNIEKSEISLIGTGGLGTWVIMSLVASGVGKIKIFDPDIIQKSNLNRQIMYTSNDLGNNKVDKVNQFEKKRNSNTKIIPYKISIKDTAQINKYCNDSDIIINCADYPSIMEMSDLVADAAQKMNKPHIVGGGYSGNLGIPGITIIPGKTLSWNYIRNINKNNYNIESLDTIKGSKNKYGSIAPISGMIGNIVAWECIKLILGLPLGLTNKSKELNLFNLEWRTKKFY